MRSLTSKSFLIFVINPGSTSTKLALFENKELLNAQTVTHDENKLATCEGIFDQMDLRLAAVREFLDKINPPRLDAVVGRGGLLKPLSRGTYLVNEQMIKDARRGVQGQHVSNLGCILAHLVAAEYQCPAMVVDPVSVDEFEPVARLSGHPLIERRSLSHALNLRAAAIWAAEREGAAVDRVNFVAAHLGGGISVAAIKGGRIIDVNDASSAGPFSPERSGSLPLMPFAELCFSGKYSLAQIKKMIMGEGGMKAYLGTSDLTVVEKRIRAGDEKAKLVFDAMVYQIAKEIGAMATVLCGEVRAIVLTGSLAFSEMLVESLKARISFIAPVVVIAGEKEAEAMAQGAWRVLVGVEKLKEYV